ncbi:MAG: polyprenyl synthetase family protein [Deltaproteobacteria bacterium]|nr:polyprenyl synthetase family protein [Deltaproteobacteria bacterium]
MDIKAYLSEKTDVINRALDRFAPTEDAYPQSIHRAVRYSLFAGGKRFRPVLVIASAEAVGGKIEDVIDTAAAFECVHTYSLVHDDLPAIDNDDLRRGIATCHKVFGEAVAILAGDALLTLAFDIISRSSYKDKPVLVRVIAEMSWAAGMAGMIGGQVADIESEGQDVLFPVLEHIHIHKTGALIAAAVRSGAILGGANEKQLSALTRYAEAIGLAFQIADDILDVEGTQEETGKAVGADEKRKKATYPALIGLAQSRQRARELVDRALESLMDFGQEAEPLRAIARYVVERRG